MNNFVEMSSFHLSERGDMFKVHSISHHSNLWYRPYMTVSHSVVRLFNDIIIATSDKSDCMLYRGISVVAATD